MPPPVVANLDMRVGETFRQAYTADASVDVSDWNTWDLVAYLYKAGVLVATCTEGDSTIVRTATGAFYIEIADDITAALTRGTYLLQVWRTDTDEHIPLMEGTVTVKFGRAA